MKRRHFIKSICASLVVFQADALSNTTGLLSTSKPASNKKIVWVVLRGAVDSLHTVVPSFEPTLSMLRPSLYKGIKDQLLPLDNGFSLHPALKNLHTMYKAEELSPIVAVGTGYERRSHFDGQDYLESGLGVTDENSGWLSRALDIKNKKGLAVARTVPISLRGGTNASTWYPSKLKEASDDIYDQLKSLYANDSALLNSLEEGLSVQKMAGTTQSKKRKGKFNELAKSCAKLIKNNKSIDCAMLEMGGWDTHNNQQGRLKRQLSELDDGIATLKKELGKTWSDTVVIIATEFGRTVRENGTGGTDHGTASAMFVAGGNLRNTGGQIRAGKVTGKWPGLTNTDLFEQRDLYPTSSSFSWIAAVLASHWQFTPDELSAVFPKL